MDDLRRFARLALTLATAAAVVGCGGAAATASATSAPRNGGATARGGNQITGEVVAANGSTFTVSSTRLGDVEIAVTGTTTVSTTQTVTLADITSGECASALEAANAGGATQAATVTISPPDAAGTCAGRGRGPGGGIGGAGSPGPSPSARPSGAVPTGAFPRGTFVSGKVTAVSVANSTITVTTAAGPSAIITVADGATLSQLAPGTVADITNGVCVLATRPRTDTTTPSATTAVTVTGVTIVPAGPSGCFSGGRGIAGGLGGNGAGNAPPGA